MPINPNYLAEFSEDSFYHVYNRTNNKELLFLTDEHRSFFLRKYAELLSPFLDTWCWALLPNHFHLMIRVKPIRDISNHLSALLPSQLTNTEKIFIKGDTDINLLIVYTFKRLFQSYAQSFNLEQSRKGNLFTRPFKRVLINTDDQITGTIIYIHANALKHKLVADFTKYKWTSWASMLSAKETGLARADVLNWFGGRDHFIKTHIESSKYYYSDDIEEDEE